ncbi:MAG: tetratricopeptide repeat protein, partial [Opitutales bacterium]
MRLLIVFAFSLLLGAGLQAQRNQPLRVELPDLRIGQETSIRLDFFDVEPQIKPEEVEFFRELLPLIEQQPAAAAARLSNEIGPDSSAALSYVLGNLYVQSQRLPQAINAYEQAISKYNEYRRAHKNLGMVHFQNGDLDRALEHLTRAVQLGDRDASNYGRLAYIYLQQDNPVAAESAYRSAIVVEPNKRDWKLGLAQTLMAQGRNQEVIAIMEPLIQADPQNAQLWLFQTNAYLGQNELEDAAINLEIIRRLGEAQASQLKLLGNIYLRSDMPQRALQTFMEVLNLDNPSENLDIAIDAAELVVRLNRYDDASHLITSLQHAELTVSDEQEKTLLQI